jgi:hypothetical protein
MFQCEKCGCAENTALTRGYHGQWAMNEEFKKPREPEVKEALDSYKTILGLRPEEPFGKYCSACCPVWYNEEGSYGVGPNPHPSTDRFHGGGMWHGRFARTFLPKGQFETDQGGNLRHRETGDGDILGWALPKEEGT